MSTVNDTKVKLVSFGHERSRAVTYFSLYMTLIEPCFY